MKDKTRLGFSILAAALGAGALGDGLLRAEAARAMASGEQELRESACP